MPVDGSRDVLCQRLHVMVEHDQLARRAPDDAAVGAWRVEKEELEPILAERASQVERIRAVDLGLVLCKPVLGRDNDINIAVLRKKLSLRDMDSSGGKTAVLQRATELAETESKERADQRAAIVVSKENVAEEARIQAEVRVPSAP
jgi:hypothetical protein